jgi:hypothetical protein
MEDAPHRRDRPRGSEMCEELQWERALQEEAMTMMEMIPIANGDDVTEKNTREMLQGDALHVKVMRVDHQAYRRMKGEMIPVRAV